MPRSRNLPAEKRRPQLLSPARTPRACAETCADERVSAASIVSSFPPQIGNDCRVLILGTMPGVRSLMAGQFYAHPQNLFWPFMGELYGAAPEQAYATRIARLHGAGIGLWDVLEHCERKGSLDSDIRAGSAVPNDISSLLETQPTIRVIALNGKEANRLFARRIAPLIEARRLAQTTILALPSTSPANASIPRMVKFERWSELLRWSSCPSELVGTV